MKYIALLRGINVGGKRKVLMADLKSLVNDLGGTEVITYIQSGNVIFSSKEFDEKQWADRLEDGIKEKFGHDVPVIVLNQENWDLLVNNNPFDTSEIAQFHVTVLDEFPTADNQLKLSEVKSGEDQYQVVGKAVYLHCKGKYHETKLGNNTIEKKLKVKATTRTWKSIVKIADLI
ncbi:DUF1697 domain-containing protein [Flammeovirga pacifica]|uniref:DUF1697 domain-containing protein n=1 Tax=Flammeovirga pacifica TaxID=915059 RepID=A0A1S1YZ69_FLAPC|nr:DUF1697 domain-containing protein [Flammeovirga pacifica]OHX66297.1 hypothetical protein NH26_07995 [Flammeovirga pacifica]